MSKDLIQHIKDAGVVGAGGAGFPTHVKLDAEARVFIVNAAECEPLIRVDQELLMSHTQEFLQGLSLAVRTTGAERAIIAIKAKHTKIVRSLEEATAGSPHIEVFGLGNYYPAGDEQIMVKDVLNKVVPRGGIPLAVDAIVSNVETLINVARAQELVPVTTTFVTIAGEVPLPVTLELPVGISYREALKLAGVTQTEGKAALDGGPLMGALIENLDAPITKTTKAILLLDKNKNVITEKAMTNEQILRQSRTACLQCQKCTDLCPRDLLGHKVQPHIIMRIANYGIADFEGMKCALGCSECGACALYACPVGLSPRRVNMLIKKQLAEAGIKVSSDDTFVASEVFDYRKIPVTRLIARLGLTDCDSPAPLTTTDYQPQQVTLLLRQHVGAPATAVLPVGAAVQRGDIVGRIQEGKLGANVHASINGTVTAINSDAVVITKD